MFKRVEKKRKKRQLEEELGLGEGMKEVLGMHDTDSDESESDSDDHQSADERNTDDLEAEELGSQYDDDTEKLPPITVQEALRDPLYIISVQPVIKTCIVCPGKLLKSANIVDQHRQSKAHSRRLKQFQTLASKANPKDNAWNVLHQFINNKLNVISAPAGNSKRAEKQKVHATPRRARRDNQKARAKPRKEALPVTNVNSSSQEPIKRRVKRQKVESASQNIGQSSEI